MATARDQAEAEKVCVNAEMTEIVDCDSAEAAFSYAADDEVVKKIQDKGKGDQQPAGRDAAAGGTDDAEGKAVEGAPENKGVNPSTKKPQG